MTVFGAISNVSKEFIYMTHNRTNSVGFAKFMKKLSEHCEQNHIAGPKYLILDGHSVHRSNKLADSFDGFQVLMLPAYSSHLSCIESLLSLMK